MIPKFIAFLLHHVVLLLPQCDKEALGFFKATAFLLGIGTVYHLLALNTCIALTMGTIAALAYFMVWQYENKGDW